MVMCNSLLQFQNATLRSKKGKLGGNMTNNLYSIITISRVLTSSNLQTSSKDYTEGDKGFKATKYSYNMKATSVGTNSIKRMIDFTNKNLVQSHLNIGSGGT